MENQIKPEIFAADFERNLAAEKGEAGAEFQQKLAQMPH